MTPSGENEEFGGGVVPGSGRALEPRRLDHIISVRLNPDDAARLRQVAKAMNLPYTQVVRLAVTRFLALPDEWQPRLEWIVTSRGTTP